MDLWEVFKFISIGAMVTVVMSYLNQGANKEVEKSENGGFELKMNKLYQVLGYLCFSFVLIYLIATIYYQEKEMFVVGGLVVLICGGLGIPCFLYYRNHRLIFDNKKIVVISWTGKVKEIYWTEITDITFSPISGYLKVKGVNKKLKIHQHIVGLNEFVKKIEEETKWKASELKLPIG